MGSRRICWRYDPVLLTGVYTIERHLETFAHLCDRLAGHVDRCIFSFVEVYQKLKTNFPELIPLTDVDMDTLASGLGRIAAEHGISIQTCGANGEWSRYGIHSSGCVTLAMLGAANGVEFRELKHRGTRHGCHCIESRDIGAYDTCVAGCKYCYANKSPQKAVENYRLHDPASPLLLGHLHETDQVSQGAQRSMLKREVPLPLDFGEG